MKSARTLILTVILAGVSASAKEPNVIIGVGSALRCAAFVSMIKDHDNPMLGDVAFAWVQGWFSARNVPGFTNSSVHRTVGGSISADTLTEFLVTECKEHPQEELVFAADAVYEQLALKGL
jgi:hypothetical protein